MDSANQAASSLPSTAIPAYVLDDLCSRFIINVPEEDRNDPIRLFFQIELAHWFYLDFYCAEQQELKTCGIKYFAIQIYQHCPILSDSPEEVEKKLTEWKAYKLRVPTYGAIILEPEMQFCLLVQGWWIRSSWGFPKGKINAEEAPHDCAVREVMEETGLDISKLINQNEFLECQLNGQVTRLYIVPGVPLDTHFQPRTRKEIKSMQWFPIDALPANKKDQNCKSQLGMNPNNFFMVIPFVRSLRKWINGKMSGTVEESKKGKTKKNQDNNENRQKQKQRQQQNFAQQNQTELLEYLPSKNNDTSILSLFNQAAGKQSKQLHILNRDGTINGNNTRRNLSNLFNNPNENKQANKEKTNRRNYPKDKLYSESWLNFKLDTDALMGCIY